MKTMRWSTTPGAIWTPLLGTTLSWPWDCLAWECWRSARCRNCKPRCTRLPVQAAAVVAAAGAGAVAAVVVVAVEANAHAHHKFEFRISNFEIAVRYRLAARVGPGHRPQPLGWLY